MAEKKKYMKNVSVPCFSDMVRRWVLCCFSHGNVRLSCKHFLKQGYKYSASFTLRFFSEKSMKFAPYFLFSRFSLSFSYLNFCLTLLIMEHQETPFLTDFDNDSL